MQERLINNLVYLFKKIGKEPPKPEALNNLLAAELPEFSKIFGYSIDQLFSVDIPAKENIDTSKIKMIILDVDGVLTDGGMIYNSDGSETKKFNVKDGMAIKHSQLQGVEFGIISAAARSEVVQKRAEVLGIKNLYVGNHPKIEVLQVWMKERDLQFENIAYIGDDVNDIEILKNVGFSACPSDAITDVKHLVNVVLQTPGGKGCVREMIDNYFKKTL